MHSSSKPTLWKHWPPQGQLRFIFTVLQFNTLYMLTCSPHRKRKIHVAAPLHQQLPWPNLSSTCSLGTITDFTIDYPHRLGGAAAPHALLWARQAHGPALCSPIHPPCLSKILPWASQAHGRAPPRGPDEPEVLPPPHPPPPTPSIVRLSVREASGLAFRIALHARTRAGPALGRTRRPPTVGPGSRPPRHIAEAPCFPRVDTYSISDFAISCGSACQYKCSCSVKKRSLR